MYSQKDSSSLVIILTTEINHEVAESLAEEILKQKLAACVSIREVQSHFWWDGKLEKNKEVQLLIKTSQKLLDDLLVRINQLHTYKTPEILHWDVSANASYKEWIEEVTSSF